MECNIKNGIMKYMGSKNRIAKHILPIILKDRKVGQWYVEPFVGGGNLIQHVDGNRYGNDINEYVIELLKEMARNGNNFDPPYLSREEVEYIKNNKERFDYWIVAWAGICCSYSGKWFGGYAGKIKTKEGQFRDYIAEAIANAKKQAVNMRGCLLGSGSYLDIVIPENNSIIYFDPPYKGTEGYRVKFDHETFYNHVRQIKTDGHTVFVSEYNMPEDFICVWEKQLSSSLSSNGKSGGNKLSTEKLFTL